jgi:hypothetical protein
MTEPQHPITPPPQELVRHWCEQLYGCAYEPEVNAFELTRLAAKWGADQELEACCEWLETALVGGKPLTTELRFARRPKPPSLSEDAIQQLDDAVMRGDCITTTEAMPALRRALKRLQQLENQQ